jgi:hypothetical protein
MSAQLRKSVAGFRLPQQLPPQGRKGKSARPAPADDGEARRAAGAAG